MYETYTVYTVLLMKWDIVKSDSIDSIMSITTSRRFKCVIQKWSTPLDILTYRLCFTPLPLWVFTSVATKNVSKSSAMFVWEKVRYFGKRLKKANTIALLSELVQQCCERYPFADLPSVPHLPWSSRIFVFFHASRMKWLSSRIFQT